MKYITIIKNGFIINNFNKIVFICLKIKHLNVSYTPHTQGQGMGHQTKNYLRPF